MSLIKAKFAKATKFGIDQNSEEIRLQLHAHYAQLGEMKNGSAADTMRQIRSSKTIREEDEIEREIFR